MPVAAGYFPGRRFALQLDTPSKLNFSVFVPAFLFEYLYRLSPRGSEFLILAFFEGLCFFMVALFVLEFRREEGFAAVPFFEARSSGFE